MENEPRISFIEDEDEQVTEPEVSEEAPATTETALVEVPQAEAAPKGERLNAWLGVLFKGGTPACGMLCGILGAAIAVLIMCVGFWETLFVTVLAGLGVFLGAVPDKIEWARALINRLFPPKEQE